MITSEEIKLIKYVLDERCIPVKTDDLAKEYFNKYITQQEKRDELLEVYRKREINRNLPHPSHADEIIYTRKIEKLESELNE